MHEAVFAADCIYDSIITIRGGFFITVQQGSTAFSNRSSQKPVIAILMDVRDDTGEVKLDSRWGKALRSKDLDVVEVDPILTDRREILAILNQVNGIFLPGGNTNVRPKRYGKEELCPTKIFGKGCVPKHQFSDDRDHVSRIMVEHAMETDKPLLAICRGMQELNVAFGGTLQQRIEGHDYGYQQGNKWTDLVHAVDVKQGSLLADAFGRAGSIDQTSIHRQGMYLDDVASDLVASAMADDGQVVEAIEHPDHPFMLGVQFHAELWDNQPLNSRVFAGFAGAICAGMQTVPELVRSVAHREEVPVLNVPVMAAE